MPKEEKFTKDQVSVCGLFCGACSLYIATTEDPERLQKLARDLQLAPEEIRCHGCRTTEKASFCQKLQFPELRRRIRE